MPHNHDHSHAPSNFHRAFAVGVALNIAYVLVQVVFGIFGHSLALLADAGHNFGDVLGLILAWGASYLAKRPSTARRTYGWRRTSIMAALRHHGPLTDGELEALPEFRAYAPSTVRKRRTDLVAMGEVRATKEKRPNERGSAVLTVWTVVR